MSQFVGKILSVYMLLLALVPCTDTAATTTLNQTKTVIQATAAESGNHDHSNSCTDDTCPPFCICDCCSVTLGAAKMIAVPSCVFTPRLRLSPSFTAAFAPTGVIFPIWSPPRTMA